MSSNYHSFEELPLTLRVEGLMPILGIGRNTAYELVRCGKIRSIRIGRQLRIPKDALVECIFLAATDDFIKC